MTDKVIIYDKGVDSSIRYNNCKFYSPNTGAAKYIYIKQILTDLKGEINSNTIRVGDFNTLLSTMDIIQIENP